MTLSFGTGSGMTDKNSFAVTNGAMIARNAAWNLFGLGMPMLVAVFSIPMLVRTLGVDRFGILSIVWMVIGYFSLFDFGLGRALTQVIAEKLGSRRPEEVPDIFWAATFLMLILGLAGAVAGAGLASWLVTSLLNVPPQLQRETLQAFYLLAVAIPVNITSIGFRGALEAHQQFRLTSIMRVIMGLVTFLVPLGVLGFSHSLVAVVAALLAGRTVVLIIYLVLCLRVIPNLGDAIAVKRAALPPLLRIGGWMTVSNMVSPLMATLDRFFLGSMVSMAAVTFYSTPFDTVTKLLIIPSALTGVILFTQDACSERLQKSGVEASPVPEQFWHGRASTSFSAAFNNLMRERWPRDSLALHCSGSSTLILSSSTGPGPLMRRRRTTLSEERVIRS